MFRMRNVARALREILAHVQDKLTSGDVENVRELMEHGEWGEALEVICAQLYEYEASISKETFGMIQKASQLMRIPPGYWMELRELIDDDPRSLPPDGS